MNEVTEYTGEPSAEEVVQESSFATIGQVASDGVTLIFDGQEDPTEKRYKCNCFAVFENGDRVKVFKDSGTYVVEYPVGNPKMRFVCDVAAKLATARKISITGGATGTATSFDGASDIEIPVTKLDAAKLEGAVPEAKKAVTLKTPRSITLHDGAIGVATAFDGSRDISIQVTKIFASKIEGVVPEATNAVTLKNARTIALSGAATGTATSFNGSQNITIPVTSLDASKLSGTIRASAVQNVSNSAANYNIQFQSDYSGKIFARIGTGAWKQISNA